MFGPVLTGAKVTLRPATDEDAAPFVAWFADTDVTRYLGRRMGVELAQEQAILKRLGESKDTVWWVIEAEARAIGATGIHAISWISGHGTTGTIIGAKDCWRKGYATEAMALRTRYAFRELNLHKLNTEAYAENEASKRALQRNGYREVGVRRAHEWSDGSWHDLWIGELLRDEWERTQSRA